MKAAIEISAKMRGYASPGLHFEVSPAQGISDVMPELFENTVEQARLTY